jgi:hypothetical protein
MKVIVHFRREALRGFPEGEAFLGPLLRGRNAEAFLYYRMLPK